MMGTGARGIIMYRALSIAVALMLTTPAWAQSKGHETPTTNAFETGNTLLVFCENPDSLACAYYIEGIADVMAAGNPVNGHRTCMPQIANSQAVDVAKAYLTKNPNIRHLHAAGLVAEAFQEAWPCRE
jgi:hypothetical protein